MNTRYFPIGSVKCHHMPESYYERWEALRKAYKRAGRSGKPEAALRAAKRLTEHENNHCTA